jgi:hypothetical protein
MRERGVMGGHTHRGDAGGRQAEAVINIDFDRCPDDPN